MRERSQAIAGDWARVYAYFAAVCQQLARQGETVDADSRPASPDPATAPSDVFRIITGRDFTYLTRKRCEPYRASVEAYLQRAIDEGDTATFNLDIGGGYRASLQPDYLPLAYNPALGELLVLYQIRAFLARAQPYCPVPIRFNLVIDNLCAHFVNGIPRESTQAYCSALRDILRHFGFHEVDLVVESEHVDMADYEREFDAVLADASLPDAITPAAQDNVERFVGRRLAPREALHQVARYAAGSAATEANLAAVLEGVRLTQRASPASLAFRPFPGGDLRIQCGEVGLEVGASDRVRPALLSSANLAQYHRVPMDISEWAIPHIEAINLLY